MPILVEILPEPPSASDLKDLQKIYQDAPAELLPEHCSVSDATSLLNALRPDADTRLYAARFNDRLLGAVAVKEQPESLTAYHLCVRKVTRNRGVAKRIMNVINQIAGEQNRALLYSIPDGRQRSDLPSWLQIQL